MKYKKTNSLTSAPEHQNLIGKRSLRSHSSHQTRFKKTTNYSSPDRQGLSSKPNSKKSPKIQTRFNASKSNKRVKQKWLKDKVSDSKEKLFLSTAQGNKKNRRFFIDSIESIKFTNENDSMFEESAVKKVLQYDQSSGRQAANIFSQIAHLRESQILSVDFDYELQMPVARVFQEDSRQIRRIKTKELAKQDP